MDSNEYSLIMRTIKGILKERKVGYKELADKLKISESSVKRIFTARDGSTGRIVEICKILDVSFFDVVQVSQESPEMYFSLSLEQEKFFVANMNYFYFFKRIYFDKFTASMMKEQLHLSEQSIFKYLKKFDEFGLLELREGNNFKFFVRGTLHYLAEGPLQSALMGRHGVKFLGNLVKQFEKPNFFLTVSERYVSEGTQKDFINDLNNVAKQYRRRAYREETTMTRDNLRPITWFFGVAPEHYDIGEIPEI